MSTFCPVIVLGSWETFTANLIVPQCHWQLAFTSRQVLHPAECTCMLHVPFSQECPQQMNGDVAQGGIILRLYSQAMEIEINWDATSNFQFPGYTFIFERTHKIFIEFQNVPPPPLPYMKENTKLNPLKQLHSVGSIVTRWWSCVLGQYRTAMVGTWRYWVTMRR